MTIDNESVYAKLHSNFAILDLNTNPWPEDQGGIAEQITFWRETFDRTGEGYTGERAEFEAFVAAHGLEN